VVKRHGFAGGRATHGSMFHRAPGSIGCSAWPSRVVKGKKLPGQMGNNLVTQKNLTVVDIREEENILLVEGAVPGAKNGVVSIYTKG
jgi:large subunit ribosomal protein L3